MALSKLSSSLLVRLFKHVLYLFSDIEAQEDQEKYRFQVELEFVQCLANPQYLNCKFLISEDAFTQV